MAIMPHSDQHADAPRRRSGPIGRAAVGLFRGLTMLGLVALAAFVGGFIWFARSVADEEAPLRENADGIVVLTGGASRITDAVDLLAAGHVRSRGWFLAMRGFSPVVSISITRP
jgi:uncharacterized SAM-binding protein YcdF (DUF218 family)